MQLALGIAALIAFALVYIFFPETSQPNSLGLDILNKRLAEAGAPPRRFVFVNPLRCLGLLTSPNVFAVVCRLNWLQCQLARTNTQGLIPGFG
jgi:hypothetical protein